MCDLVASKLTSIILIMDSNMENRKWIATVAYPVASVVKTTLLSHWKVVKRRSTSHAFWLPVFTRIDKPKNGFSFRGLLSLFPCTQEPGRWTKILRLPGRASYFIHSRRRRGLEQIRHWVCEIRSSEAKEKLMVKPIWRPRALGMWD